MNKSVKNKVETYSSVHITLGFQRCWELTSKDFNCDTRGGISMFGQIHQAVSDLQSQLICWYVLRKILLQYSSCLQRILFFFVRESWQTMAPWMPFVHTMVQKLHIYVSYASKSKGTTISNSLQCSFNNAISLIVIIPGDTCIFILLI